MFRAADRVFHRLTGETWILAIDQFGKNVSPCGWPETIAEASDCILIKAATDEQRITQLMYSLEIKSSSDVRKCMAANQLFAETSLPPTLQQ